MAVLNDHSTKTVNTVENGAQYRGL